MALDYGQKKEAIKLPCGDCRRTITKEGYLQMKIEGEQSTFTVDRATSDGVRCTMSCSAKLMRWTVLGIQGNWKVDIFVSNIRLLNC